MSEVNMNHMEFLDEVAQRALDQLQSKERHYRGSWKKRGGTGAFHMLARKWDRIENMCSDNDYDIFTDMGSGEDGSLIAEVRDLRSYLMLVEAEYLAREHANAETQRMSRG